MGDLWAGIVILTAAASAVLYCAWWVSWRVAPIVRHGLLIATLLSGGYFALHLWQDVRLASWLPFANLIVVGNWLPLFAASMVGLAWPQIPGGAIRKTLFCSALLAAAWTTVVWPMLGAPAACGDRWTSDGYCLQTTDVTCTPACAASLLRQQGIVTTEQEMADLCLTRGGTSWQGLYRGLKRKTQGTPWTVRILSGDVNSLLAHATGQSPLILSVGIEHSADVDGFYELEQGWRPGIRHSVLLLGESKFGRAKIVDPNPALGHEQWSLEDLKTLYRGPAIQLIRRD